MPFILFICSNKMETFILISYLKVTKVCNNFKKHLLCSFKVKKAEYTLKITQNVLK
jgi:hypothetical protein